MPWVPAHLCECALGMLQGGMRTADLARAINCNVCTVRCLRGDRETGRTDDRPRSGRPRVTSHLQDRYRMATTARDTPATHNPSIIALTVRNIMREAGLRACRPVVRQVLTRHHQQQCRLWAQTHVVPFLQAHTYMTLHHDNATSHTARSVRDFLQDRNVCVLPWPAKNPDLNPIEHV